MNGVSRISHLSFLNQAKQTKLLSNSRASLTTCCQKLNHLLQCFSGRRNWNWEDWHDCCCEFDKQLEFVHISPFPLEEASVLWNRKLLITLISIYLQESRDSCNFLKSGQTFYRENTRTETLKPEFYFFSWGSHPSSMHLHILKQEKDNLKNVQYE